ncbi:DUF5615 family PIN-like protein [Roseofilum sp. BLCC_M154]|uniref:DUF5615 family PIN-like protein n=1 Tax=Roseofilum acuticapitatum BLCC-M154 TaxID=3022444 RepID=A0ABT7AMR6_9CYAN|nr:DUF5615 family PIN-like protein [Roseofilum acuticapitatum BLCC-M154]
MLLFDQNLSPRLVDRLADIYPNSMHVDRLGLGSVPDRQVWDYAIIREGVNGRCFAQNSQSS